MAQKKRKNKEIHLRLLGVFSPTSSFGTYSVKSKEREMSRRSDSAIAIYIITKNPKMPVSQNSNSKGLFGVLPYIAPEIKSNQRDLNPQAISITKNASLIIQPVRPSLDYLNPAIREIFKIELKSDTDGTYCNGHHYEYGNDVEKDEALTKHSDGIRNVLKKIIWIDNYTSRFLNVSKLPKPDRTSKFRQDFREILAEYRTFIKPIVT
ncbi:hypothetical protein C2G38_2217914 [Gigaspora rosea]|uniref:Uncharacterized protein n=1 Tax=Gigaspora rosea TaxID=44941 RepID=A0A397U8T0_9GLOM|nr:hypothetical protein C2G38_2217914 [Gigaspora rosea]